VKLTRLAGAAVALAAALTTSGIALASTPQAVTITVPTSFNATQDPFHATGGVVCDEGTVSNGAGHFVGWQSNTHAEILLQKLFECPDGSFDILLRITLDFESLNTVATWSVIDGSGAYESLRGAGTLTGERQGEIILDVYTGNMHLN